MQEGSCELTVGSDLSVSVCDGETGRRLGYWHGPLVRYLIECRALPLSYQRVGVYTCDRCLLHHLRLSVAAARMGLRGTPHYENHAS